MRFRLNQEVSHETSIRWTALKKLCESAQIREIVESMRDHFRVKSNNLLSYLDTKEGALVSITYQGTKGLEFRRYSPNVPDNNRRDNDIVFEGIYSTNEEKWMTRDLDDFIQAFLHVCRFHLYTDCVKGVIEMVPKKFMYGLAPSPTREISDLRCPGCLMVKSGPTECACWDHD